jgi:hypothetical protein
MNWSTIQKIVMWTPSIISYGANVKYTVETIIWAREFIDSGIALLSDRKPSDGYWVMVDEYPLVELHNTDPCVHSRHYPEPRI